MEGPERRVMSKTWSLVATCEERIVMMKKLIQMDLGVAEVEELGINIRSKFKSAFFKNKVQQGNMVDKEAVKSLMILKLRDEKKYLSELLRDQKEMRKRIEIELNKNSRPARNLLREFRMESAKTRKECRVKYEGKIQHLKRKYRDSDEEEERKVPPDMEDLMELTVFDKEKYSKLVMQSYEVKVIGDVQLEENEKLVLKLHPKFAILPRLLAGGLDVDEELANSKLRMQLRKEMEEKKAQKDAFENIVVTGVDMEEKIKEIEEEAKGRQVFDPVEKRYDERKRRVTDLKECNRVTLPKPLPATEEAKIEIRREVHRDIYDKYRAEHCDKKGNQRSNLSKEEQEGLRSLEKKVKERKLIVIKTDKSSRFAVCSEDAYLRMGKVHTSKDKKVTRGELVEIEKLLNSHCVAWGKLWRSGEDHDHRSRIINSKKTSSENTADLYILLKDHKEGEKTRPVVTGCTSNTLGMSNNTASIMEAVAASFETPFESISSEDMISKTKEYNKKILERRRIRKEEKFRKKCEEYCQCINGEDDKRESEADETSEVQEKGEKIKETSKMKSKR